MKCTGCGAPVSMDHPKCPYCGTQNQDYFQLEMSRQAHETAKAQAAAERSRQIALRQQQLDRQENDRLRAEKAEAEAARLKAERDLAVIYTESPKSRLVALLLCGLFGWLGVHRFYLGKIGTGIVYAFTFGAIYVGWAVDFIMILCGAMKDKQGLKVKKWLT